MVVLERKEKKHFRSRTINKGIIEGTFRSRIGTAVAHVNQKQRVYRKRFDTTPWVDYG
jgi:hypothetical protein